MFCYRAERAAEVRLLVVKRSRVVGALDVGQAPALVALLGRVAGSDADIEADAAPLLGPAVALARALKLDTARSDFGFRALPFLFWDFGV